MRKGLTATLMTVAVALLAVQAMAMAPVIGEIPSPIVGNETAVTGVTGFIFPDALNINSFVSDDNTTPGGILWTYSIEGTAKYAINGAPLLGGDSAVTPPSGKVFNTQLDPVENSSAFVDKNPATITVRNINFTPLSGTGATPSGSGILDSEIQAVTLYASDGSTVSSTSIFFYTDAGGLDRLSPGFPSTREWDDHFSDAGVRGTYTFANVAGVTSSDAGGTAICLNVPGPGNNLGMYFTDYGKITLVQNAVYRLRMTMSGSNAAAGTTPLWDVIVDNTNNTGSLGYNAYGADYIFFDNMGGAESVISTPKTFDAYFTPPAVGTARWNDTSVASGAGSSLFSTANSANKDARVTFRVLDTTDNPGIQSQNKVGSVCMTELICDRYDLSSFQPVTDAGNYYPSTLTASNSIVGNIGGMPVSYDGAGAVFSPSAVTCLATLAPGAGDASTVDGRNAGWPVPWVSQTLYKVTFSMNAGSTPPGVYWIIADAASTEVVSQAYTTNLGWAAGMPQSGASQDFVFFMYSNFSGGPGGGSPDPSWARLRPWLMWGGTAQIGGGTGTNAVVHVTNMKMERVTQPQ